MVKTMSSQVEQKFDVRIGRKKVKHEARLRHIVEHGFVGANRCGEKWNEVKILDFILQLGYLVPVLGQVNPVETRV